MKLLPEALPGFALVAETAADFTREVVQAAAGLRIPAPDRPGVTIGYLNAAQVNLAYEDPQHAAALQGMTWLYADGQAIVWAARRRGAMLPERINAGDFTRELMVQLATAGVRVALVGGAPGEAARAADLFRAWAPALQVVFQRDGFFGADQAAREATGLQVLREIEAAGAQLVLVGMGAPRQEQWVGRWAAEASQPRVWWCVGALFEYYAGTRRRAPVWMRRAGLEWAVRLVLEPGRLWKRYLIGNPQFIWRMGRGRPPG